MSASPVSEAVLAQLFTEARTHHRWTNEPVDDAALERLYEVMKWGPTSVNSTPARVVFLRTEAAKERLLPALMGANVEQIKSAPVVAIVGYDERFVETLPRMFPSYDVRPLFDANPTLTHDTAFRNSSLQGAYMILAARALGLDVCPMSGFDNAKVDELFLGGTSWRSNFLCVIGHGDTSGLYPRGPRLDFDEACRLM